MPGETREVTHKQLPLLELLPGSPSAPVPWEVLAEAIWGDRRLQFERAGRTRVRNLASELRTRLGKTTVITILDCPDGNDYFMAGPRDFEPCRAPKWTDKAPTPLPRATPYPRVSDAVAASLAAQERMQAARVAPRG